MFKYTTTNMTISEINEMFVNQTLIVDDSYQRRYVWLEKDMIRLVETILLSMVVPELFFWKAKTDPQTGRSISHIVDGQQRIKAIADFVNGSLKLSAHYLTSEVTKTRFGGKFFNDLTDEERVAFWNYRMTVIDIDSRTSRDEIIDVFNRLNLTNYALNEQEKRNSKPGLFADLVREIAREPFWERYNLFTSGDARRMKDEEFCANLIILYRKGIVDQMNQKVINNAYKDMVSDYPTKEEDKIAIINAMLVVESIFKSEEMILFAKKKSQLYTLFSFVFLRLQKGSNLEASCIERLNRFAKLYSRFKNNPKIYSELSDSEKIIFNWLNSYKLASSEGSRKHSNRVTRFEILSSFADEQSPELISAMNSIQIKFGYDLSDIECEVMEE